MLLFDKTISWRENAMFLVSQAVEFAIASKGKALTLSEGN